MNIVPLVWDYMPEIFQAISTSLVVWGWWSLKRIFITRADLDLFRETVNTRLKTMEDNMHERQVMLTELDHRMNTLFSADEASRLGVAIKDLEGDIKSIRAQMNGIAHSIGRLELSIDRFTEAHMR